MNFNKKEILLFFGLILGLLTVTQIKAMSSVSTEFLRDSDQSVFQEIKILKDKNKELSKEVADLSTTLENLSDQDLALEAVKSDIKKYKMLSGQYPVFGPGVEVIIDKSLQAPYLVDLVNELYNAGANAVAINDIRLTNETNGIDSMPNGQIFIDSFVLSIPYKVTALGEPKTLSEVLYSTGGIIERLKQNFPALNIVVQTREVIKMT